MAILESKNFKERFRLDLQAWQPGCGRDDPHSYRLLLHRNDLLVYDEIRSVAGWQVGHDHIYEISRAFRYCGSLYGKTLGYGRFRKIGLPAMACSHVSTDWLKFTLWSHRLPKQPLLPDADTRIQGLADLRLDHRNDSLMEQVLQIHFVCSLRQALRFSNALVREGRAAAHARLSLTLVSANTQAANDDNESLDEGEGFFPWRTVPNHMLQAHLPSIRRLSRRKNGLT